MAQGAAVPGVKLVVMMRPLTLSNARVYWLPAGSQYTLAFDSVSGRIITTNFTPGTAAPCAISAETVSGDLEIRNP